MQLPPAPEVPAQLVDKDSPQPHSNPDRLNVPKDQSPASGTAEPAITIGTGVRFVDSSSQEPQQQNDPASQHANITARFEGIYNAWNPVSPQCRFQVYLFC